MNKLIVPVENDPSYSKDLVTGAILNTDNAKLMEYKSRAKTSRQIKALQDEINILKTELESIKSFLKIS